MIGNRIVRGSDERHARISAAAEEILAARDVAAVTTLLGAVTSAVAAGGADGGTGFHSMKRRLLTTGAVLSTLIQSREGSNPTVPIGNAEKTLPTGGPAPMAAGGIGYAKRIA